MTQNGEIVRKSGGLRTAATYVGGVAIIGAALFTLFTPDKHNPPHPDAPSASEPAFGCKAIATTALGQGRYRFSLQMVSHHGENLDAGIDFGDQTPQLPLADPTLSFEHHYQQSPNRALHRTVSAEIIDVNSILDTGQAATCSVKISVPPK